MQLRDQLVKTPLNHLISAGDIGQLLQAVVNNTQSSIANASRLDLLASTARQAARASRRRASQFTSPASIVSGGVVRPVSGVVTLPERRRTDVVHAGDGSLRATAVVDNFVGTLSQDGSAISLFDDDSATGWTLAVDSPIEPDLSFVETGAVTGAYLSVLVSLDLPQIISQVEIGLIGSPAQLFRVENADTGAILYNNPLWIDPGSIAIFAAPVLVQHVRLHFLQPHGVPHGTGHRYRLMLTSIALYDIVYADTSTVVLPTQPTDRILLRPLLVADGSAVLQALVNNGWAPLTGYFTLPDLQRTDTLPVYSNSAFLTETPEELDSVVLRLPTGQSSVISLTAVKVSGNLLSLPMAADGAIVTVGYRYRPQHADLRLLLTRTTAVHTTPIVKEAGVV